MFYSHVEKHLSRKYHNYDFRYLLNCNVRRDNLDDDHQILDRSSPKRTRNGPKSHSMAQ